MICFQVHIQIGQTGRNVDLQIVHRYVRDNVYKSHVSKIQLKVEYAKEIYAQVCRFDYLIEYDVNETEKGDV